MPEKNFIHVMCYDITIQLNVARTSRRNGNPPAAPVISDATVIFDKSATSQFQALQLQSFRKEFSNSVNHA
jgi:hypothetical protein